MFFSTVSRVRGHEDIHNHCGLGRSPGTGSAAPLGPVAGRGQRALGVTASTSSGVARVPGVGASALPLQLQRGPGARGQQATRTAWVPGLAPASAAPGWRRSAPGNEIKQARLHRSQPGGAAPHRRPAGSAGCLLQLFKLLQRARAERPSANNS